MSGTCCACSYQETPILHGSCGPTFTLFMALLEYVLRSRCDVADPCGRLGHDDFEVIDNAEYDYVVVGAGVAGTVVAARLSEDPSQRVLLLEAGPEEPIASELPGFAVSAVGTAVDWNFTTVAQQHACLSTGGVCNWPRGKMVSGTGGMQGMMYTRGHSSIFDGWAEQGNEGWSYDEVLPYFIKAENNKNPSIIESDYHGFNGPLVVQQFPHHPALAEAVVEAGQELGYRQGDLNGKNQTGINIAQMMVHEGLRGSTSRMYLRPASNRTNLHLSINSHATKILIDSSTSRATGVQFLFKNGELKTVHAKKEVIVSGGAVGSPQLLLLSGLGPKEDLQQLGIPVLQDLPVGRNLHNHVSVGIGFFINDTSYETLNLEVFNQFLDFRNGPLSGTGLTQTTGFLKSKYATGDAPDLQVFFDGFNAQCSRTGLIDECSDGSVGSCGKRYIYSRPTNILPLSKGYLKLNSINPLDQPLIDPKYLSEQRDVDVLVEGLKTVVRMSQTAALQRWGFEVDTTPMLGCESHTFGTDPYWECVVRQYTGAENHQAGTCKMGPVGDAEAVIDSELKVHGVPNIRVVDASIFPYAPNSNPISVIIMAAEKCSDMIKATWQGTDNH